MRNICLPRRIRPLLTICLAIAWVGSMPSVARGESPSSSFSVEMSRVGERLLLQGEPIIVHYKIANLLEEDAAFYMGQNHREWVSYTLRNEAGKELPLIPDPRPIQPGGYYSYGILIGPRGISEGNLVVSKSFAAMPPGVYRLSVRIRLPYETGKEADPP